jgi:ABC-2 type transport system ATP-binding protein
MIEIEKLTKIYPNGHRALNALSLQIGTGMFGLVGPNGAGKTTLMRILATLLRPTDGHMVIFGNDLATFSGQEGTRNLLGYLPQEAGFHLELTVEQELDYLAILKRVTRSAERARQVTEALERVGLYQARRERVRTLSGGMKRRLGIAIALLGNPRLIIVDEPTAGLDPAERVRFRNLLFELAGDRVVILSTHIIEDVNQICSDLAILRDGNLLFRGSPKELVEWIDGKIWAVSNHEVKLVDGDSVISWRVTSEGGESHVFSDGPPTPSARPVNPTLEDAYLWLVQGGHGNVNRQAS